MTPAATLALLQRWRDAGALRALDLAFVRFVHGLAPDAPAGLLVACALLARLEGQGHGCLPLDAAARDPAAVLGEALPEDAAAALALLPADAEAAAGDWAALPAALLEAEPRDERGVSPLVRAGARLYLRRYWRHERRIALALRERALAAAPAARAPRAVSDGPEADAGSEARARDWLDRLFPPAEAAGEPDWQRRACERLLDGRLTVVTGGPGTGKTWTAARALVLLQALHEPGPPLRVALAAPTGKAAARLRQAIAQALLELRPLHEAAAAVDRLAQRLGPARTLHALLGTRPLTRRFEHDEANPLDVDLLIVDEASMVHLEMMDALLAALRARARLLLLGDRDQLASVEAGAVLGDLCGVPADAPLARRVVTLRRSRRFDGAIGALAAAVNRGDGGAALAALQAHEGGALAIAEAGDAARIAALAIDGRSGPAGTAEGWRPLFERLAARPAAGADFTAWALALLQDFDRCRVLAALREGPWGVSGLNTAVEQALARRGWLDPRGEWYAGRPVMVTRNDPSLGLFNGDIGLVLRAPDGALKACFADGERLHAVSVTRLAEVQTAFALTVHKSQGSEFGHVLLVLPDEDSPVLTRELLYTGITRARHALSVVAPRPALLAAAAARPTRRFSGLAQALADPGRGA
ncbi:MAG: exodeoxyribonuclease V subunit alpha [Rubrivivax sp.]|nr:exodeoxyribonuclease V subunit alpha [Rubrivivax sp.]